VDSITSSFGVKMKVGNLVRHINNGDFYTIISIDEFGYILYDALRGRKWWVKAEFLEVV